MERQTSGQNIERNKQYINVNKYRKRKRRHSHLKLGFTYLAQMLWNGRLRLRLLLHSDSIHCYKMHTIEYTILQQ